MVNKKLFALVCSLGFASCKDRPEVNSNTTSSDDWMVHYAILYKEPMHGGRFQIKSVLAGVTLGKNLTVGEKPIKLVYPASFQVNTYSMTPFDISSCDDWLSGRCNNYNYINNYLDDYTEPLRLELRDNHDNKWINGYHLPSVDSTLYDAKINCTKTKADQSQVKCDLKPLINRKYNDLSTKDFIPHIGYTTAGVNTNLVGTTLTLSSQQLNKAIDCPTVSFGLSFESQQTLRSTPGGGGDLYVRYDTQEFSITCNQN